MLENEERGEGEGSSTTKIRKNHLVFLNDWSHKNKPLESCAILAGKRKDNQFNVLEIIPMENDDKSDTRFSMNEEKLFVVYKKVESIGLSVVGIYHNHPSKPIPSKTDMTYMRINPVPWVIYSTTTHETRCYIHSEDEGIKEIELMVMD
jgi:[CysO sulfur-carrier protein]-S-L-cysteine hydrolase